MSEPFVGEVRAFCFKYAPENWAFCAGETIPIEQYQVLYAVIGIAYGGDGRSTFRVPNLQGRAPVCSGQRPGLSYYLLGEDVGWSSCELAESHLPVHSHDLIAAKASPKVVESDPGAAKYLSSAVQGDSGTTVARAFKSTPDSLATPMSPDALGETGGGLPHENRQPFLAFNFCIALEGVFPPRS